MVIKGKIYKNSKEYYRFYDPEWTSEITGNLKQIF
jgi:hypothetical protein